MWQLNAGRFKRLRNHEREYLVCRIHGRPGGNMRPRFGIKRQPTRLLIDYGEGICGVQWDFYCRRQREHWGRFKMFFLIICLNILEWIILNVQRLTFYDVIQITLCALGPGIVMKLITDMEIFLFITILVLYVLIIPKIACHIIRIWVLNDMIHFLFVFLDWYRMKC